MVDAFALYVPFFFMKCVALALKKTMFGIGIGVKTNGKLAEVIRIVALN